MASPSGTPLTHLPSNLRAGIEDVWIFVERDQGPLCEAAAVCNIAVGGRCGLGWIVLQVSHEGVCGVSVVRQDGKAHLVPSALASVPIPCAAPFCEQAEDVTSCAGGGRVLV